MDVILMERVENLGQMGDVVTVKDGYARNYLLPQHKALRATDANRERFEQQRADLEARNIEKRGEAEGIGDRVDDLYVILIRQSSDTGQLYGSANARDIANSVTEAGFNIERKQVLLDRSIKTLGIHPVRVSLHPEVTVSVNVNIARSDAEAEQQEAAFRSGALAAGAPAIAQTEADGEAAEAEDSAEVAAEVFFEDAALTPEEDEDQGETAVQAEDAGAGEEADAGAKESAESEDAEGAANPDEVQS
ncbi:MAG: 50S ribosomal protein L9 [Alphaproteobacteria bacterium]|nr:50S ribosomal protein L9 [Alphaproteobacteria bacterium]|tara:strand:- start:489 stop:1232 length:744 start_codon:yes stop_codon:yes gene_type:complete